MAITEITFNSAADKIVVHRTGEADEDITSADVAEYLAGSKGGPLELRTAAERTRDITAMGWSIP